MNRRAFPATLGVGMLAATCTFASCSDTPSPRRSNAHRTTTTSSTEPVTEPSVTTSTQGSVAVPNVIGLKIGAAHRALRRAGFGSLSFNLVCNKGTLASQSVVLSIALPGTPAPSAGATQIEPGALVPPGSTIGLMWSGCYGDRSVVPAVVGTTFAAARRAIQRVGLTWACYSIDQPRTPTSTPTTRAPKTTTTTASSTSSTMVPVTAAPAPPVSASAVPTKTVVSQVPAAGAVERPGSTVAISMRHCPQ